jgi:hypothetical protein
VFASDSILALGEDWTGRLQRAALWEETRKRTSEFTVKEVSGPTPAGGVRAVAIINAAGQIAEITEYDADGQAIRHTLGQLD